MSLEYTKTRFCVTCSEPMEVPKNSGKKYCSSCLPEHNREKARKWYTGNIRLCRQRASRNVSERLQNDPVRRMLVRSKSRATTSGLEFNITRDDIVIPEVCPILKTPFEYKTYYTMSVDRIDSTKGYVKGNVQVISHKANAMKNSATPEELHKFAEWILTHVVRLPDVPEVT